MTPSERNWAQIEKEALAVLYGLERFDQHAYGRAVTVQNDHKPLAAIPTQAAKYGSKASSRGLHRVLCLFIFSQFYKGDFCPDAAIDPYFLSQFYKSDFAQMLL